MGADGGICYIGVKDAKAYEEVMRLAGWLIDNLRNQSAWGYTYPYSEYHTEPQGPGPWEGYPDAVNIEGAYGTDCDYQLEYLYEFVRRELANEMRDGPIRDTVPIAQYTFRELQESYLTRPKYSTNHYNLDVWYDYRAKFLVDHLDDIPDSIKDMTLGEWSRRINELIIGYYDEETWT